MTAWVCASICAVERTSQTSRPITTLIARIVTNRVSLGHCCWIISVNSGNSCLLFINVVQADKSPAAFGQLKNEANRCVFPVVWGCFKRTVDLIVPGGFFSRFGAGKTLGGIGLAFKDFVISAQEIFLVVYGFYPIGHRQWECRYACHL